MRTLLTSVLIPSSLPLVILFFIFEKVVLVDREADGRTGVEADSSAVSVK